MKPPGNQVSLCQPMYILEINKFLCSVKKTTLNSGVSVLLVLMEEHNQKSVFWLRYEEKKLSYKQIVNFLIITEVMKLNDFLNSCFTWNLTLSVLLLQFDNCRYVAKKNYF